MGKKSKVDSPLPHTIDQVMTMRKKPYTIEYIHNGKDPKQVIREIVKGELKKVLEVNEISLYNLDEIVSKYVSGEMCNERKER